MLSKFETIIDLAKERKGSQKKLQQLLVTPKTNIQLEQVPDDRYFSTMTRCVNNAGFNWSVVAKKWPQFEEAFYGFDLDKLKDLSDGEWRDYTEDSRVVRSWQKISATRDNTFLMLDIHREYGGFGKFLANWSPHRQVELHKHLKKYGTRLGGMTAQYFLRWTGYDAFILSPDVVRGLQENGLDISDNPTSQKDTRRIQETFNIWHEETNLPYCQISQILAFATGQNYSSERIQEHQ